MGFVQNGATKLQATGINQPTIASVVAGNSLICVYGVTSTNVTSVAPTDSSGQTWTIVKTFANALGSGAIAWLQNANAGTHTLSWATHPQPSQAAISEWNGLTAIGGTPVSNSATAATLTSASYTPGSASEAVIAFLWEEGTAANDAVHCNTAAFQGIGSLTDSGGAGKKCWAVNQNGNTSDGMEANAQIVAVGTALTCAWAWTGSIFCFSIVAGFTLSANVSVSLTGSTGTFSAGTLKGANDQSLAGSTATFTAGSVTPAMALALTGQTATFTPGTLVPALSLGLTGQTATFTSGTMTIPGGGGDVTVSLTGSSASFTAGTLKPAFALTLPSLSIASTQGSLTPASALAITGISASFASGTLSPKIDISLVGGSAAFSAGTMTVPGDVTVSITGLSATFSAGNFTVGSPATQDAGRRVRNVYRVKIDGVVFECRSYAEAIALLDKAKETAAKLAEDQAIWAVTEQQKATNRVPVKPIEAPKIEVSSRDLRSAANQAKREIKEIYEREARNTEMRVLLELAKRANDDDETIILLM